MFSFALVHFKTLYCYHSLCFADFSANEREHARNLSCALSQWFVTFTNTPKPYVVFKLLSNSIFGKFDHGQLAVI